MALAGQPVITRSSTARSVLHAFDPGGNPQDRESQLWRDVFANPADWWDNRVGKRTLQHPDFRHKRSKEALWLNSFRKPSWVDSKLALLHSTVNGDVLGSPSEMGHSESHASCGQDERPIHEHSDHVKSTLDTGITLSQKIEQLWKDLFSNPTKWWDNRMDKRNPNYPDFRHKSTRVGLWLESQHKPAWVDQKLASFGTKSRAEREAQNWKDLILNPSEWWDNRMDKKNLQQPDFRHKISGQPLWLDSHNKPSWVDFQLATFNAYHKSQQGSMFDNEVRTLCEAGQLDNAVDVVSAMDQQGLVPSEKTYLSLLKACKQTKALTQAKFVYAHLVRNQVRLDGFLGEHLVYTLAKCGVLDDALQVFRSLSKRSVFTWTAMISGYNAIGKGQEALDLYNDMQAEGVDPDAYTFVSLLRACASLNDLLLGKKLHADILKFKCEADVFVSACSIDMFAKCGSLPHAQTVFNELSQRDVVSWTAMLSAYVEHGQAERALNFYNQMKEEGFSPDEWVFTTALQACCILVEMEEAHVDEGSWTRMAALSFGQAIHAEASMLGFESDSFVGVTLISMYGKTGHVLEAESVFERLSVQSVASWTVMLTVYAEQGLGEMAVNVYRQMQLEGFIPNEWTFVAALQACSVLAEQEPERVELMGAQSEEQTSLTFGKELHEDVQKQGLDKDVFVVSSLVTMYSKCGNLLDAEMVFEHMPVHNVVSYNAMLSAYLEHGQEDKVPCLYKQMQAEGSVNERTLVIALQACTLAEMGEADQALNHCLELHTDVWKRGFDSSQFVVSALVNTFSKCGSLLEAENVFDRFSEHDIVSWNGVLTAYMEQGDGEMVLHLYREMQEKSKIPDAVTLLCVLQACSEVRNLDFCGQVHFSIASASYDSDLYLAKALIHAYGSCGSVFDAQAIFDCLPLKSVVLWNALIAAYVRQDYLNHERNNMEKMELTVSCAKKALKLCNDMKSKGTAFNEQTAIHALQACCKLAEVERDSDKDGGALLETPLRNGQAWHLEVYKRGFESNVFLGSALVSMYGKCGRILEAEMVFEGLAHRNLLLWNAMMSVYSEHSQGEKVLHLHRQMEKGVAVDDWVFMSVLQACISTGDLELCRKIHRDIVFVGLDSSLAAANTLMHVYGSCACMADAQAIFDVLDPNVVSWTALIAAYARQGDHTASLRWYEKMRRDGFRPNEVTFLSVLSACNHAGFVDKAFEYFTSMKTEYGIEPNMEHYGIMLDLLGRVGDFVGVKNLLSEMPMQPDLEMWLCLLGSCREHGNVELGKQAFDCAMLMQPKHAGAHVLMSNIFADTLLQESVEKADRRWGSGVWEKYDERWVQHEQKMPLLWEMATDLEVHAYP